MNYKFLSGTILASAVLLGACGNTEDAAKDTEKSVKESAKKVQESAKKVKAPTVEAEHALNKAKTYSNSMFMSKKGIYNKLTSKTDKFSADDAKWAVDNLKADFKKNAANKAEQYYKQQKMSKDEIKKQLTSKFDAFTEDEATYAVDQLK